MGDPGVVDQHVQTAPQRVGMGDQGLNLGLAGNVGGEGLLAQVRRQPCHARAIDIGQQQLCAFGGGAFGNGLADPLRRAGNDAALASQPRHQMIPTAFPARVNMPMMVCTCSAVCSAQSEQRSRVMLAGVAGGRARFT